jgi:hypothetical protein
MLITLATERVAHFKMKQKCFFKLFLNWYMVPIQNIWDTFKTFLHQQYDFGLFTIWFQKPLFYLDLNRLAFTLLLLCEFSMLV